jgi:hypothetical protein
LPSTIIFRIASFAKPNIISSLLSYHIVLRASARITGAKFTAIFD